MTERMTFHLRIWRQPNSETPGHLEEHTVTGITPETSFLEMLDLLNEDLLKQGIEPFAIDSDCREGICGTCGLVIDGVAHGPKRGVTTCELRMRHFRDGATITVEPFRARSFPVVKDLVVDRSAFDRIVRKGGYVSVNTGSAPEANSVPVPKRLADEALDSAVCIGCGACVAACPNASASLFTAAKISQFVHMPQGRPERQRRVLNMVRQMDDEGFGNCSNHGECEAVCPKGISISNIARMRREYLRSLVKGEAM